jgi:hypothetical protein
MANAPARLLIFKLVAVTVKVNVLTPLMLLPKDGPLMSSVNGPRSAKLPTLVLNEPKLSPEMSPPVSAVLLLKAMSPPFPPTKIP